MADPTKERDEQGSKSDDELDVEFEPDPELETAIVGGEKPSSSGERGSSGDEKNGKGGRGDASR